MGSCSRSLVAVYGGTNGAASVITALNIAYEEKEKRSLLRLLFACASLMTVGALVVALCAIAGTAAVAYLQRLLPQASDAALLAAQVVGYLLLVADRRRCRGDALSLRAVARRRQVEVDHAGLDHSPLSPGCC